MSKSISFFILIFVTLVGFPSAVPKSDTLNLNTATATDTTSHTGTDTDTAVFSITVEENSSIAHLPSTIVTGVNSGEVNSSVLQINNTGNTVLSSMNLDCYTGTLCNGMTVSFNNSGFQIGLNDSTTINVTLTAPVGLPADNYV